MAREKKSYLVDLADGRAVPSLTMETHLPCEVGDVIFRPRLRHEPPGGLIKTRIVGRREVPDYDAWLTIEDVQP